MIVQAIPRYSAKPVKLEIVNGRMKTAVGMTTNRLLKPRQFFFKKTVRKCQHKSGGQKCKSTFQKDFGLDRILEYRIAKECSASHEFSYDREEDPESPSDGALKKQFAIFIFYIAGQCMPGT